MKQRTKLPVPARSVSSRQIHVRGPIRTCMDQAAVQRNADFGIAIIRLKKAGLFNEDRCDIVHILKHMAVKHKLHLPNGVL